MKVLVGGGAGYIGSVCVANLLAEGHDVAVVDNLSHGHRSAVSARAHFFAGDIGDEQFLHTVFREYQPDAVMHFCALSSAAESVSDPLTYYHNNVAAGLALLRIMKAHAVDRLIFSSSAAVYGEPSSTPIDETAPALPVNPYGRTKLVFEQILADCARAWGLRAIALRYFNAAGATPQLGEDHRPETHLIPIVLETVLGRREAVTVYGDDYPTRDGSCVRDYIHVADLARAHVLALEHLDRVAGVEHFNLGNGAGFSVFEIIRAAETVTGSDVRVHRGSRRAGDPAILVASSEKIRSVLGWQPDHPDIHDIIASAWEWKRKHPDGYPD